MNILQAAAYRLVAELACIAGVVSAAVLADHDKSVWVWGWFLLFGFVNMITGNVSVSSTEAKPDRSDAKTATP